MATSVYFEGKVYSRPDDLELMYISEAAARLKGSPWEWRTNHTNGAPHVIYPLPERGQIRFSLNKLGPHSPEGLVYKFVPCEMTRANIGDDHSWTTYYTVRKVDICYLAVEFGYMNEHESRRIQTESKMADADKTLALKRKAANELQSAAFAAAFAINQSKDEVEGQDGYGLMAHWRNQEHEYILALEECEKARTEYNKYATDGDYYKLTIPAIVRMTQ